MREPTNEVIKPPVPTTTIYTNEILTLKENIFDPVREFMNGQQRVFFQEASHVLKINEANFNHIEGDEPKALKQILRAEINRDRWWWRIIGIIVSLSTVITAVIEILRYVHS